MRDNNLVHYGQHFLIDQVVLAAFLKMAKVNASLKVLEIGPGEGALTKELAKKAQSVTAVEIDETLKPPLDKLTQQFSNLQVFFGNVLEWRDYQFDLVCGALSYAIYEPLMIRLYRERNFNQGVFLVSLKVKANYEGRTGLLGYLLRAFFRAEFSDAISPREFKPAPRAPGVIVKLTRLEKVSALDHFWQELFWQQDKKLRNSLRETVMAFKLAEGKTLTKKETRQIISGLPTEILEKTIWQLSNESLGKVHQFIVYFASC